ncbi:fatty acid desaturase [Aphanizomenon flos-aquae NRERC-008]|jgi:beta-carotene hydroxylase|uniref:Fatty acid desaturase n=2 Tax=Aphanizomenon flos-aquae TaxID=1176 RepID=A0ABR8INY4_APHFL|nr:MULTISPECIES: fatty acid desaturase [Aphanizomenon]MBD1218353.1 fatty acid desaturase [Aphanizomenon flos-aquae Clear-A1]MBO1042646.1 beta-carotene hydroxylase [Aphanizomenon flos-aquae UKL13-PB]MCE2906999.1 fatty acid desaturase [Anabaena sp. CoA2_C59]MDJ0506550.1 fatty acid desaturase [Nostocales cyanobacterium LE14-WE12]NTW19700.1 beta-carotene hydroxylase [Nostocales cyanobacterium W4_Combined_metabat2_030]OBQ26076.1 MAG: beta-carotene hydroxylase [Aphanizomenon flos-aquae LD13]OBQ275
MLTSEAQKPLTIPPKELLSPPGDFNPTLLMFLVVVMMLVLSNFGYWLWEWPHWLCFSVNTLALHCSGTVIHDACHQSAHRNRIINAMLGHCSALILAFAFPVFTRVHLQHHGNVNHPKDDPDHYVSTGGPLWLIAVRFLYHEVFFFQRRLWRNYELLEWFISRLIIITIVYISVQYHFLGYILNFWFIPAFLVGIALGLFFDYLPHRPFTDRNRWKNARVYPGKVLNILILGQNYHLIHHLWPSIPWYNYQPAYDLMKPLLDEKGSPQTSGLLQKKDFLEFLYDIFIGIHFHH